MDSHILILTTPTGDSRMLRESLTEAGHTVHVAFSVADAARVVRENPVILALLESNDLDGRAQAQEEIAQLRPDCKIAIVQGFESTKSRGEISHLGASDYIINSRDLARLAGDATNQTGEKNTSAEISSFIQTLDVVVALHESNDPFFVGHSSRVARLVTAITNQMQLPEATRDSIVLASLLRDLGKAAVPKNVLHQPGSLTQAQRERLERHVHWSVRLLEHIDFPGKVLSIIRHHHERYDGNGYPDGLRGRQIPLGSRIIAAADAFAAMMSPRPHRAHRTEAEAVAELVASAGTQLDPEIVESLVAVLKSNNQRQPSLKQRTILLVDRDSEIRALLKMKLTQEGHRVVEVTPPIKTPFHGQSAIPDLILYDSSDGGDEALAFLEELRRTEEGRSVPLALLTAGNDRIVSRKAFRCGVDDVIDKLCELENIVARIGNILAREEARGRKVAEVIPSGISGDLDNLPLHDIVQILCIGEKTAGVTLKCGDQGGGLWFEKGTLVHAESGDIRGEEAFAALAAWPKGTFSIVHGETAPQVSIESDPMWLLLEHCRVADETSALVDAALESRKHTGSASEGSP